MQDIAQTRQPILDTTGRPGIPWGPVVLLLIWCAIEGTACAFALRPTMSEVLSDLTGFSINPIVLVVLLSIFLTIIVAGSFACFHTLNEAIKAKHVGNILNMILVELVVAMFQVLFLYRALVDAMTPWLAQQGVTFSDVGTLALASFAWVGVRGMTWYLFGRSGAPTLAAVLERQAGTPRSD